MDREEKIRLLNELLIETEKLPLTDDEALDKLLRRIKMIIYRIFEYTEADLFNMDLEEIHFYSRYTTLSIDAQNKRWKKSQQKLINLITTKIEELTLFGNDDDISEEDQTPEIMGSGDVFIVHGHDDEMKEAVARLLKELDLNPVILHEQPNKGKTIIEKFSEYAEVSFAIILLSPDDICYSSKESLEDGKHRARQNVIFELGFFIGKLGRRYVFPLKRETEMQLPSDYSGIIYTPFDKKGGWKLKLVQELKAVGFEVDANRIV